jgi:hypothetical protein
MARGRKKVATVDASGGTAPEGQMLDEGGDLESLHPFVVGLLQELPAPGAYWAPERRSLWLTTATSIFQMIYTEAPPPPPPPVT